MKTLALNISYEDLLESLKKLSRKDKKKIHSFLESELSKHEVNEPTETYLLSEESLLKDWLSQEEEQAWKDL
ncbi:hypothetical protein SAMN03080617_03416 [Algoriphagus alkaliphilus]|jgi:mRNA-degrading endonuclease RelE of RelBE toxin-antitoxin system|uniref:DUF2281 domain-containing protein n=1 Tax=Algoriphagus alkaliphilus TaxID=279824 RepID=A0A1G5Z9P4_9BACT|nr:hypothetical protein [Algoriphagus alkaliphilus]MBA4301998.1 hypothetical protein [Cyclobacterium sp.]MDP3199675.1 hypothetical protein [Algoriphagus sp.]SDA91454.1 hypothetical protein SAMN03080617_03416 [Algoriphagus alkaliphilus]